MRRATLLAAIALAALAAGCGRKADHARMTVTTKPNGSVNYTVKGNAGESVNVVAGEGAAAAAKTPAYAPVFPGAVVQSTMTGAGGEGSGGMVMFQTKAKPADVIAFYKDKAKAAGFATSFESQSGESQMFNAAREQGGEGFQVVATAADGSTTVQLVWSNSNKG